MQASKDKLVETTLPLGLEDRTHPLPLSPVKLCQTLRYNCEGKLQLTINLTFQAHSKILLEIIIYKHIKEAPTLQQRHLL